MIYVRKHQKNLTRGARRCLYLKLQKWANNPREVQESFIHLHVFSSCCSHWRYKIRQVLLSLIPCSMEERGTRKGLDVRSGTTTAIKRTEQHRSESEGRESLEKVVSKRVFKTAPECQMGLSTVRRCPRQTPGK